MVDPRLFVSRPYGAPVEPEPEDVVMTPGQVDSHFTAQQAEEESVDTGGEYRQLQEKASGIRAGAAPEMFVSVPYGGGQAASRTPRRPGEKEYIAPFASSLGYGLAKGAKFFIDTGIKAITGIAQAGARVQDLITSNTGVDWRGYYRWLYPQAKSEEEAINLWRNDLLAGNNKAFYALGKSLYEAKQRHPSHAKWDMDTWIGQFIGEAPGQIGAFGMKYGAGQAPFVGMSEAQLKGRGYTQTGNPLGELYEIGKEGAMTYAAGAAFGKVGDANLRRVGRMVGQGGILGTQGAVDATIHAAEQGRFPTGSELWESFGSGFAGGALFGVVSRTRPGARTLREATGLKRKKAEASLEDIAKEADELSGGRVAEITGEAQASTPREWNTESLVNKDGKPSSAIRTVPDASKNQVINVTVRVKVPERDPVSGEIVTRDKKTGEIIPGDPDKTLKELREKYRVDELDADLTVEMGSDIYGDNKTTSFPNSYAIRARLMRTGGLKARRVGPVDPKTGNPAWVKEDFVEVTKDTPFAGGGKKKGQHPPNMVPREGPDGKTIYVTDGTADLSLKMVNGVLMRGHNPWQKGREWEPGPNGQYTHWVAVITKSGRLRPEPYLGEEIQDAPPPPRPPGIAGAGIKSPIDGFGEKLRDLRSRQEDSGMTVWEDKYGPRAGSPPVSDYSAPYPVRSTGKISPDLEIYNPYGFDKEIPTSPLLPNVGETIPGRHLTRKQRAAARKESGGTPPGTPTGRGEGPTSPASSPRTTTPAAAAAAPEAATEKPPPPGPVVLPAKAEEYLTKKLTPGSAWGAEGGPVKKDTVSHARYKLNALFEYFRDIGINKDDYGKATIDNIRGFIYDRLDGLEPITRSGYVTIVKQFYAHAEMPEFAKEIAKLSPGKGKPKQHRQLTDENYRKFTEDFVPKNDLERVVHYLLQTTARTSDLVGTRQGKDPTPEDLIKKDYLPGLTNQRVKFQRDETGAVVGATVSYRRKSKDTANIPVPLDVARALERLMEGLDKKKNLKVLRVTRFKDTPDKSYVIPMTDVDLNAMAKDIQRRVGIPEEEMSNVHGLRGKYASNRFNKHKDLVADIAEMMGHDPREAGESYINVAKESMLPSGSGIPTTAVKMSEFERAALIKKKALQMMEESKEAGLLSTDMYRRLKKATLNSEMDAWIREFEPQIRWLWGEEGFGPPTKIPKGTPKAEFSHRVKVDVQPYEGAFIAFIEDPNPKLAGLPVMSRVYKTPKEAAEHAKSLHTLALELVGTPDDVRRLLTTRPEAQKLNPPTLRERGELLKQLAGKRIYVREEDLVKYGIKVEMEGRDKQAEELRGYFTNDPAKGIKWDKKAQELLGYRQNLIPEAAETDLGVFVDSIRNAIKAKNEGQAYGQAAAEAYIVRREMEDAGIGKPSTSPVETGPKKESTDITEHHAGLNPFPAVVHVLRSINDTLKASERLAKTVQPFREGSARAVMPSGKSIDPSGSQVRAQEALRPNVGDTDRAFGIIEHMTTSKAFSKAIEVLNKKEQTAFLRFMDSAPGTPARLEAKKDLGKKLSPDLIQIMEIVANVNKWAIKQVEDHKDPRHQFDPLPWYAPHIFRKTLKWAQEAWRDTGKIKALYDRGFMKERMWPDLDVALKNGAELITTNPIELYALRWYGMLKYVNIQKAVNELETTGDAIRLRGREKAPPGYEKVDQFGDIAFRPGAAAVFRNYLSHTLWTHEVVGPYYSAFQRFNHTLNMFQLGLGSFFHISFTALDAQMSTLAEGFHLLSAGHYATGGKYVLRGLNPLNVRMKYIRGKEIIQQYYGVGLEKDAEGHRLGGPFPGREKDVELTELSGGGYSQGYRHGWQVPRSYEATRAAIRSGDKVSFAKNFWKVPAELSTNWIMDNWVPYMKAATFSEMMGNWILMNPGATRQQIRAAAGKNWNMVDGRLGAVRYDRLFIQNWVKNIGQMFVRAPGWKAGTLVELGLGAKETMQWGAEWFKSGKLDPPTIPRRMAYLLAMGTIIGGTNALLSLAFTGKADKDDFWAFRTGAKDEKGRDVRFILPSYAKDIHALLRDPIHYLASSASPFINFASELVRNRTYYGEEIIRPGHKAVDTLEYTARAFIPFWARAAERLKQRDAPPGAYFAAQFGIMPASPVYSMTAAESTAEELYKNKMGAKTYPKESAESRQARQRMIFLLRSGRVEEAQKIMKEFGFDRGITKKIKKQAGKPYIAEQFRVLNDVEAARVWDDMSPQERALLRKEFIHKLTTGRILGKDVRDRYLEDAKRGR